MYGAKLPYRQLHATGSVTHLREYDGRAVHVVGWTKKQIAEFNEEQARIAERIAREKGEVIEPQGPSQTAQMNRRLIFIGEMFFYLFLIGVILVGAYWLGVGW